ncbi:MAG TPA: cation:proton antiporter family protein [Marinospirillum sp.]|uniref:cation:proton antiporter family protein n=1 Tax=Marinospirillum sp. TaxID=2183934 RepID=UPI002B475EAB|nr:cation:proton antiporter family protein [Marinospirillum sp.]HKM14780.1 cation:proton antiporter family protein [Marinospirillum sp.]
MTEAVWIIFAFGLGAAVKTLGLPPLIGYLAAGFAISASSQFIGLPAESTTALQHLAHLGVLLLLFTVGLKLKIKSLAQPEVVGGGLIHFIISCAIFAPGIFYFIDVSAYTALMLAVALSFSSTVLAAKVLEGKRELRAFHGRVAIGILVIQDLIALFVMSLASGSTPSMWALVVFGIPLLRPIFYKLLDFSGQDELLVLLGLLLALVIGGFGFESVGLSSELGALAFGALLANHPRSHELSKALWSIKEVFLIGFFLQIGIGGLPDSNAIIFALVVTLLLPIKGILFFFLLLAFKLRARSAFLTGLSLTNFSEFGLIVASLLLPEWLVPLALAVSLSFLISAPLYRVAQPLYEKLSKHLVPFERKGFHPDEQPLIIKEDVLIIGLGRTGTAAYLYLENKGLSIVGIDSDPIKVEKLITDGFNAVFADAEDQMLWQQLQAPHLKYVLLTANDVEAKIIAATKLRANGFTGVIISHSSFTEDAEAINAAGANYTHQTFSETGIGLAKHLLREADKEIATG